MGTGAAAQTQDAGVAPSPFFMLNLPASPPASPQRRRLVRPDADEDQEEEEEDDDEEEQGGRQGPSIIVAADGGGPQVLLVTHATSEDATGDDDAADQKEEEEEAAGCEADDATTGPAADDVAALGASVESEEAVRHRPGEMEGRQVDSDSRTDAARKRLAAHEAERERVRHDLEQYVASLRAKTDEAGTFRSCVWVCVEVCGRSPDDDALLQAIPWWNSPTISSRSSGS